MLGEPRHDDFIPRARQGVDVTSKGFSTGTPSLSSVQVNPMSSNFAMFGFYITT